MSFFGGFYRHQSDPNIIVLQLPPIPAEQSTTPPRYASHAYPLTPPRSYFLPQLAASPTPSARDAAHALTWLNRARMSPQSTLSSVASLSPTSTDHFEPPRLHNHDEHHKGQFDETTASDDNVPVAWNQLSIRDARWHSLRCHLLKFLHQPRSVDDHLCLFKRDVKYGDERVVMLRFVLPTSIESGVSLREWQDSVIRPLHYDGVWPNCDGRNGAGYTFVTLVVKGKNTWITVQDISKVVKFILQVGGHSVPGKTQFKSSVYSYLRATSTVPQHARKEVEHNDPFLILLKKYKCTDMCRLQKVYLCSAIKYENIADKLIQVEDTVRPEVVARPQRNTRRERNKFHQRTIRESLL